MPHELPLGQIFVPPAMLVVLIAVILAALTVNLLNRFRLSRFFVAPPLVFVAIIAIYTIILGTFVISI